jgi:hypothetical protein
MKKLLIYAKNPYTDKNELIRRISVSADFIGIGKKGQINIQEFKNLAGYLEPHFSTVEVLD